MPDSRIARHALAASSALVRGWQTTLVALLGAVIVLGVGFAHLPQVHDAAHDTRHAFNFPCH
jgi:cobalt transporter subunit CbtB